MLPYPCPAHIHPPSQLLWSKDSVDSITHDQGNRHPDTASFCHESQSITPGPESAQSRNDFGSFTRHVARHDCGYCKSRLVGWFRSRHLTAIRILHLSIRSTVRSRERRRHRSLGWYIHHACFRNCFALPFVCRCREGRLSITRSGRVGRGQGGWVLWLFIDFRMSFAQPLESFLDFRIRFGECTR